MMGKELQLAKHSPEFHIEEVGLDSPLLEAVVKLHTAGKSKLGPFPMGAFEDHARQKLILAAVASDKSVAGYPNCFGIYSKTRWNTGLSTTH